MNELPNGWAHAPLGQVATTKLGRMLSASRETGDHPKPYLRNRDVQWGHINVDHLPVMDFGPNDAARFLLHPGDVLVCEGGEVGRAAIWTRQLSECYYQKALHRVRTSPALLPKFLLYLLEHYARTKAFERYISGSTIAHLPQEDLRNLPVPIPPVAEQERIVAAVEEQFSQLDVGLAALESASDRLVSLRSSLLRKMTEGGWDLIPLGDLTENHDGRRVPIRADLRRRGPYPYYGAQGIIDYVDDYLFDGDFVLIAEDGANLASRNQSIAFQAHGKFWVNNHAHIVKPKPGVLADYLVAALNANSLSGAVRGTAQPKLTQKALNRLLIPVPPESEQARLVTYLQQATEGADVAADAVKRALRRATFLRSSILDAAFSGKLVTQEVNDESAHDMLNRLAIERTSFNSKGTKRISKPRARRQVVTA